MFFSFDRGARGELSLHLFQGGSNGISWSESISPSLVTVLILMPAFALKAAIIDLFILRGWIKRTEEQKGEGGGQASPFSF